MQLLKHPLQTTLSYSIFPLVLSIISYLIETLLISYFPALSEFPNEGTGSTTEPWESFGIALLRDLRRFMMNSYHSYFCFMGIMLILHIVALILPNMRTKLPQNQRGSTSVENHPAAKEPKSQSSSLKKCFQLLIYFTISYYVCHLLIPNIPLLSLDLSLSLSQIANLQQQQQELSDNTISNPLDLPLHPPTHLHRILEEAPKQSQSPQETSSSSSTFMYEIKTPKSNLDDPLPLIAREKGALSIVLSKNDNKLFQLTEQAPTPAPGSTLTHNISAMDISNPFAVKTYPSYSLNLEFCYQTLALSSDSSTLFVIDCAKFYIFNVSNLHAPPELISLVQFAEWNSTRNRSRSYNDKPSVALYEEENAIIIVNNGLHIYGIKDLTTPNRLYENKSFNTSSPVTVVPGQKKALFGGKQGLTAYDISDLQDPKPFAIRKNLLKDQFIFTIYLSDDQKKISVGALIPDFDPEIKSAHIAIYTFTLNDIENMSINKTVKVDGLTSCRLTQSFLPDSVLPDFKTALNSDYVYWTCGKDYGYLDISDPKLISFTSVAPINAIALAQRSRILLRVDSEQLNFFALYQNIQRNDSFIWKPNFIDSLKLGPNISNVIFSKKNYRVYFINQTSDDKIYLQLYFTRMNMVTPYYAIELPAKPSFCVASDDGKFVFLKMDPETIQIVSFPNSAVPKMLDPINFPEPIDDKFVVSSDGKMIFVTQTSQWRSFHQTAIYTVNISDPSYPEIKQLVRQGESNMVLEFSQLMLSKDSNTLYIHTTNLLTYNITDLKNVTRLGRYTTAVSIGSYQGSFILSPDEKMAYVIIKSVDYLSYKRIVFVDFEDPRTDPFYLYIPNLAGNLPLEISQNGNFLYLSTPEYLMEINITQKKAPFFSRLMKINMKQFALTKDSKYMYAVIGNHFEIIDLRTKHSLISFKEDFPLGASYTVELKLLEANYEKNYDPVYSKHKLLTTNFFKSFISHIENEPILSYSVIPTWINFDKDTSVLTLEPRLPSHLGSYKIWTTGSLQVPSSELFSSIPALRNTASDPENILTDLVDRGYLDEDRFITAKFNASRKLLLSNQYSQFESDIRYFLRQYVTGQEFTFTVSSSLSLEASPSKIEIETLSPHYLTVHIYLRKNQRDLGKNETCRFVQRTYSTPRSILNDAQTLLILEGPLLNINNALDEVIVDFKQPDIKVQALITVFDNMNPSVRIELDDVSKYFNANVKPLANPNLLIQNQVKKQPLVANRPFSIALHPNSYYDPNNISLEYSLDTKLEWLDLRGLSLTGTPPKKLLPEKVDITITIANEFKSEKLTFTLEVGISGLILIQYIVVYFGYLFSAYKGYKHFHKFYNVVAQRTYQYPKMYMVSVDEEVTDMTMTPIGFFGKEYKNANLLMLYLENYIRKNSVFKRFTREKFADYFGETSRYDLNKDKLIKTIRQMIEGLTFIERHSVKYYLQVDDEHQDIIHQIILDEIILTELHHRSEKRTLKVFNKIKDQWIDMVEPSLSWQFALDKTKLELAIQNIGSRSNRKTTEYYSDDSLTKKNELLDISDNDVRSRYLSNTHLHFTRTTSVEAPLLTGSTTCSTRNKLIEKVNLDLLELAIKAYAFKSHHINAHREQVTIISKERKVGSSCFFKIKALLRFHLHKLQFSNKEDLGYGLKYMFQKNVLHFYGIPEANMEYDTLVVQILNKREMVMREIYIFGAENKNRGKEQIEPIQEQL